MDGDACSHRFAAVTSGRPRSVSAGVTGCLNGLDEHVKMEKTVFCDGTCGGGATGVGEALCNVTPNTAHVSAGD